MCHPHFLLSTAVSVCFPSTHKRMQVLDNKNIASVLFRFWFNVEKCTFVCDICGTELDTATLFAVYSNPRHTDPFYKSAFPASKVTAELWSSFNWVPSFRPYWHQPITVHEQHTGKATHCCGERSHAVRDYNWLFPGGWLNETRRQSFQTDETWDWYG